MQMESNGLPTTAPVVRTAPESHFANRTQKETVNLARDSFSIQDPSSARPLEVHEVDCGSALVACA
jgi:hypothetical protein